MGSDLSSQLIAARTPGTQFAVQAAVLKKSQDMEMGVASMLADSVSPPPPGQGQGLKVDKRA